MSSRPYLTADNYGSYYVTIPCAAQSRVSIDGRGNASDGLRSITPCPTLHDPPLAKARGEFNMGHFSVDIYALPGSLLSSNQHPVGVVLFAVIEQAKGHHGAGRIADGESHLNVHLAATARSTYGHASKNGGHQRSDE